MKVLFVMTDKYPDSGACTSVLRNLLFQGKLKDCFTEVHILTVKHSTAEKSAEAIDEIHIHRIRIDELLSPTSALSLFKQQPWRLVVYICKKIMYKARAILHTKTLVNKCIKREIVKFLKANNSLQFDLIIPIAGDFSTVDAVMEYTSRYMPRMIVYQVDPCATNFTVSKRACAKIKTFERTMYDTADAIITTSIIIDELKLSYGCEITAKFTPMEFPNVVPAAPLLYGHECLKENPKSIVCMFAGSLYGGIRDPSHTCCLFNRIADPNICLYLVGVEPEDLPQEYRNTPLIKCLGGQSLDRTRALLNEADYLVNIGNRMTNQVPSKLFEYISYGKPIINIYKNELCPSLRYLEKYPYCINLLENADELGCQTMKLSNFIHENLRNRVPMDDLLSLYKECTPEYCSEQFAKVIGSITKSRKPICNKTRLGDDAIWKK